MFTLFAQPLSLSSSSFGAALVCPQHPADIFTFFFFSFFSREALFKRFRDFFCLSSARTGRDDLWHSKRNQKFSILRWKKSRFCLRPDSEILLAFCAAWYVECTWERVYVDCLIRDALKPFRIVQKFFTLIFFSLPSGVIRVTIASVSTQYCRVLWYRACFNKVGAENEKENHRSLMMMTTTCVSFFKTLSATNTVERWENFRKICFRLRSKCFLITDNPKTVVLGLRSREHTQRWRFYVSWSMGMFNW